MIEQLIHVIKLRQAELAASLAFGNATTWEAYQRMVGEYQGLQYVMNSFDRIAEEEEGKE
jgi:hypothetical protein